MFFNFDGEITNLKWLDSNNPIKYDFKNKCFEIEPFDYGTSFCYKVARFTLK